MTSQKKILLQEIKKIPSFFDAYEFHNRISKINSKIGLATIYRFLNRLEADGEIHSFICDNKNIYSNSKKSHAHFRCEKCGQIKHIQVKKVDFLNESLKGEICHFQIELCGLCQECKEK